MASPGPPCECWKDHARATPPWTCSCACHKQAEEPEGRLTRSDAVWLVEQMTDLMKAVVIAWHEQSSGSKAALEREQELLVSTLLQVVNKGE